MNRRATILRQATPIVAVLVQAEPAWLEDLRLFATGWIGGLIFFGTLLS